MRSLLFAAGALAVFGGLSVLLGTPAKASTSSPNPEPGRAPLPDPMAPDADLDLSTDDETALARMLESETQDRGARIVIGWLTIQRARRSKRSLFDFLTRGRGYGHFQIDGRRTGRHASTFERPSAQARALARQLLADQVRPSAEIRRRRPGSWIERKQGFSDEKILAWQQQEGEGVYAKVAGTRWILLSPSEPAIAMAPFIDATSRLDAVPSVRPTDPEVV